MPGQFVLVGDDVARIVVLSPTHGERHVLVDTVDLPLVTHYHWCVSLSGRTYYAVAHARVEGRRTKVKLHKLLTGWPETDHWNHDGLDNRRANLRPANRALNNANRPLQRNSTSGYKGVTWDEGNSRWSAQIKYDHVNHRLGLFDDPVSAARAYDAAAVERWGEFALGNFTERTG